MTKMMKKSKVICTLPFLLLSLACFSGCGKNSATIAVKESDATEREGQGQIEEQVVEETAPEIIPTSKGTIGLLLSSDYEDTGFRRQEGEIRRILADAGYTLATRYAYGNPKRQELELKTLSKEEGLSLLLIDAVDCESFGTVLGKEEFASLPPVIAYRQLVMHTDKIKYFVTFDMRQIGHQVASEIAARAGLDKEAEPYEGNPKTIEFYMEGPGTNDGLFLFNGIMEGLDPYFENGCLECRSGQMTYEEICRGAEGLSMTKEEFTSKLDEIYGPGEVPDILFFSSGEYARMAVDCIGEMGYSYPSKESGILFRETHGAAAGAVSTENKEETGEERNGSDWTDQEDSSSKAETEEPLAANTKDFTMTDAPVDSSLEEGIAGNAEGIHKAITDILSDAQAIVTGEIQTDWPLIATVGAKTDTIHMIQTGEAAFTIFMDERSLAQTIARLAVSYLSDEEIEVSDYQQYDNGMKLIGTVTCPAQVIDSDNYQLLVDNGYYEQYQLHFE